MIDLLLPPKSVKVLCLGAHPDDIEIGCGGALLSLARARQVEAVHFLLTGSEERVAEARSAAAAFWPGARVDLQCAGLPDGRIPSVWNEAKAALEELARGFAPDVVFAPRTDDAHQDHRTLAELVTTVWRDHLVLRYEIPKWDGDLGRVTHYVSLDDEVAEAKTALLDECYGSQTGRDWWNADTFRAIMRLRGIECRAPYAEGFLVEKARLSW